MFRLLQGFPRALRNTVQATYNTHHRSPAATHSNAQDDGTSSQNKSSLSPSFLNNHIVRLHSSASGSDGDNNSQKDEWKSFKRHDHWQSFRGAHNHYEAVGWGTAIIISLQLCRGLSTLTHPDENSRRREGRRGPKGVLTSIAHAMPMLGRPISGVPMSVLDDKRSAASPSTKNVHYQNDARKNFETSEELEEAFQKLQSVSDESVGMAHNALGLQEASQGNLHVAAQHFLKGSILGYSKAQFNMAVCYEQGRGVNQNFTKALELYQDAAAQGHAMAQYNLGVFHLLGRGDAEIDSEKAVELITTAARQGLTQAQSYLGAYYLKEPHQDAKKAFDLLKQAAKKQDKEALFHLGMCYQYGLGIDRNTAKAASYYHKAASKGYMPAVYSLGTFYEHGLGGLPENLQQAKELYQRASQGGCQEARLKLIQLEKREAQKQTHSRNTQRGLMSRRTKKASTLKHSRSQTAIDNRFHTSASEPVLSTTVTTSGSEVAQSSPNSSIVEKLSYLGLFLPYYYSIRARFPGVIDASNGKSEMSNKPPVVFQVGGEVDESEVACDFNHASVRPISSCLNPGMSSVVAV